MKHRFFRAKRSIVINPEIRYKFKQALLKNKLLIRFSFLLASVFLLSERCFSQIAVFDTIEARINADLHRPGNVLTLDKSISSNQQKMVKQDSCWSDLNYLAGDPGHLARVLDYVNGFTNPKSKYFRNPQLYRCIVNTLDYWYVKNPVNKNWYFNIIGFPTQIGKILILLKHSSSDLPGSLKAKLISRMNIGAAHDSHCQHSANQTDVALHYLYRACLTKDTAVLDTAVKNSLGQIQLVNNDEGIQYDYSFFAHGKQEGIASYGAVYISDQYNIAYYLHDTPYALRGSKLKVLSDFYKNTYLKSIRGVYYDFNVLGRGISREGALMARPQDLLNYKVPLIDPANDDAWKAAKARINKTLPAGYKVESSHTHFWQADYDQHIRPGYSFNVRTVSTRTLRTERGNNENILGNFLPDGSTNIQRSGNEYFNIMPVWDWGKIPGTTSPDFSNNVLPGIPKDWGIPGSTPFVGGVSDDKYGVTTYDMKSNNVSAKKSWFFFDREVVCLGAGINATNNENRITTVNQCWLKGTVTLYNGKTVQQLKHNNIYAENQPAWVLHDSIGYFFPTGGNVSISTQTQSGNWHRINEGGPTNTISGKVFKMWLNHGYSFNGKYAYIVVPGIANKADMQSYPLQNIRILENTDTLQAVQHTGLDMIEIVFFKAGKLTGNKFSVAADKPCTILLKNLHDKRTQLYLADPSQQCKNITVNVQLPDNKQTKQILFNLPEHNYAGSTVYYTIEHVNNSSGPVSINKQQFLSLPDRKD